MQWQIICLRVAYAIAIVAVGILGVWIVTGNAVAVMTSVLGNDVPPDIALAFNAIKYLQAIFLLLITGVFVFLMLRPYNWGKFLSLLCAMSWLGFCGVFSLITGNFDIRLLPALIAGITMASAFVLHHIASPAFSMSYLRASAR